MLTYFVQANLIPKETQGYLHRWIFVIRRSTCGQFDRRYPKTPDVGFEIVAADL